MTVGGDRLDHEGKTSTKTASLETMKTHLNSVTLTKGARHLWLDICNMHLNTTSPSPEHMRTHISLMPDEIKEEHNVHDCADEDGFMHVEIAKASQGPSQSGCLATEDLKRTQQHMEVHPQNEHRSCGNTKHKKSASPQWSTILE